MEDRGKFFIMKIYYIFKEFIKKVFWNDIVCFNYEFLKLVFMVWVVLLGKLRIKDVVSR